MRLLHNEIDVVPGRKPQHPAAEGMVGPGSAILRLQNTTSQVNAYTVRLRCDAPFWRDDWYALRPLPNTGADGAADTAKADQHGPNDRWVKVYVSRGGTRDIQIAFDLPQKPDARAGIYPFKAVVETHVGDSASASGARDGRERFTEIPAVAIVRPFYRWSLDMAPEERRVGILRRASEFEIVVTNEGNDWLYCDLKPPRHKDLLLDAPTMRLAVPPPEPGESQFQRSVPLQTATRLKALRGAPTSQPVPLTASRVDAPSVPPLPEPAQYSGSAGTANTGASVIETATNEVAQIASERALLYCPPVPTTLTGFMGGLVQNGRTLVFTLLGLAALVPFATIAWERIRFNGVMANPDPKHLYVEPQGKLPIQGGYLVGAVILIKADGKVAEVKPKVTNPLPPSQQKAEIDIPKDIEGVALKDGKKIKIAAQRLGILPFLKPLLPYSEFSNAEVTVGKEPPPPALPVEDREMVTSGKKQRGERFRIVLTRGPALPADGKKGLGVLLGDAVAHVEDSQSRKIVASVPQDAPEGPLVVTVLPPDGGKVNVKGNIEVVLPPPPPPPPPPGQESSEQAFNDLINKQYDVAVRHADQSLQSSPNSAVALALKALALARQGRSREALDPLESALRLTKGKTGRAAALALAAEGVLLKGSNSALAKEYFRKARQTSADADVVLETDER